VLQNVSNELEGKIDELDGIEELESADQEKIKKAFQDGQGRSQTHFLTSKRQPLRALTASFFTPFSSPLFGWFITRLELS
jgi:hypothetical protein